MVHRCVYGLPTTVRVAPRLEDGTPFPTVFWLTCPLARKHVGRLEAEGEMAALSDRLQAETDFAEDYAGSHERYVAFRDSLEAPLPGDPGAGGMPDYVKCLHVQLAHTLATGDNPVGRWTCERIAPMPCPGPCVEEELLERAYGPGGRPERVVGAPDEAAPPAERPNVADDRGAAEAGGTGGDE
ncbi:MAG: DUF501 domain-containing protein [Nitriliruptorales bacterium]